MSLVLRAAAVLVFVGCGGGTSGQSPSPAELVASYEVNASSFSRARVTWHYGFENADGFYKTLERTAQLYRDRASSPDVSEEQKAAYVERAEELMSDASGVPRKECYLQDFWADGTRIQVRVPSRVVDLNALATWSFPDDPISPETLAETYADTSIRSFDPHAKERLRIWGGRLLGTLADSSVQNALLEEYDINFKYPPLSGCKYSKNPQRLHPVDAFFLLPVHEMQVNGCRDFDGVKVVVLEHRAITKSSIPSTDGTCLEYLESATAYLDPARGCIPLRIEYRAEKLVNGVRVDSGASEPERIVRVSSIKPFADAFYPTSGVEEVYAADPSSEMFGVKPTAESFKSQGQVMPAILYRKMHWEVSTVDLSASMPASMFALEFPNGTRFYNEVAGRPQIQGTPNNKLDETSWEQRVHFGPVWLRLAAQLIAVTR